MKHRGKMISFEGIDGAGKSTFMSWFVHELEHRLAKEQISLVQTREPGGTPLGEQIRALLLNETMLPTTEALLMFAARQELFSNVILPALTRGDWVVSDRFVDASFAYQGGGRGLATEKLEQLNNWVLEDFHTDYTLIFDVPEAVARQRRESSRDELDRFEKESDDFFTQVRETYLTRAHQHPERYAVLVNEGDPSALYPQLTRILDHLTEKK